MATKKAISVPATVKTKTSSRTKTDTGAESSTRAVEDVRLTLTEDQRKRPHYLLVTNNGEYFLDSLVLNETGRNEALKSVSSKLLADAFVTDDYSLANSMANLYGSRFSGKWRLTVCRLVVDRNGFAVGSTPMTEDTGATFDSAINKDWNRCSMQNAALAEAAAFENQNEDAIFGHLSELKASPMFHMLVKDFHTSVARDEAQEPDWYLSEFAARVLYAGIVLGRLERGQRNQFGQLIFDNPYFSEPETEEAKASRQLKAERAEAQMWRTRFAQEDARREQLRDGQAK